MALMREIRARARHVIGPVLGICAVVYFAFHAVHGERGFIAWWHLKEDAAAMRARADIVADTRRKWEEKVGHLRPDSLDADLLDEQARRMLSYAAPDETVILTGNP